MLYALPDHDVMERFLPGIGDRQVTVDEAVARIGRQPGYVPVAINPAAGGLVYFADIGDAPLHEWKFIYTIQALAEAGEIRDTFSTPLALLARDDLEIDSLEPDGLIFHVSRCGSTLLTKALARSPANLTINQGGPLQEGFWRAITDHWRRPLATTSGNLLMLRNLVLLMARRRRPEYRRCFVKFISWNVIYLDFIRAAFPDAKSLYLYRNPVEVIATVLQETTAVLRAKGQRQAGLFTGLQPGATAEMDDIEYLAHCYAHYFDLVLQSGNTGGLYLVNYDRLKDPEVFADLLERGFGLIPEAGELERMREQYRYYSKDDSDQTLYRHEGESLLHPLKEGQIRLINKICDDRPARLDRAAGNLYQMKEWNHYGHVL